MCSFRHLLLTRLELLAFGARNPNWGGVLSHRCLAVGVNADTARNAYSSWRSCESLPSTPDEDTTGVGADMPHIFRLEC